MSDECVRVLLIEDCEDDYRLTCRLLEQVEWLCLTVAWASTFEAGLDAIRRGEHDVVLLDNHLGAREGLELLRRAVAAGCRVPIIILTGLESHTTDLQAIAAGAADFLDKNQLSARLLERSIRYAIERRRAEDAHAAERNLLRTLIDSIPDYIFVKDTQNRFIMVNDTVLAGSGLKTKEDILGKTDFDFFPADIAQAFYEDEQHVMATGQAILGKEEASVHLRTGQPIWYSTTKVPLRDRHGTIIGLIGISRDITERKLAEQRAFELSIEREKVRLLTSFIETSSHDLRTPLTKMAMALHIARRTESEAQWREKLDAIESNIMGMISIMEEMQLLARLESGLPVEIRATALDNILQGTPGHIQRLIQEKNLRFHLQPENEIVILGNAELLRHAFFRLLHNAILYTPPEGTITVQTRRQDTWGVIEVADTGVGMENTFLETIFDFFTKVNPARTSDGSGAGLGLAIVKKIMELHNGTVTVTSIPGQGSTFCLLLPLAVYAYPQNSAQSE